MLIDLPLEELRDYRASTVTPPDFDEFWTSTLAEARSVDGAPQFVEVDDGYVELLTQDVTFAGFGGDPIKGWFIAPRRAIEPLPTLVSFIGYGGGRGLVGDWTQFAAAGFAQFVMDTRGQGSRWRTGDTWDGTLAGPGVGGVMTRGIESRETYYYRRLFVDAARAVDAAVRHPLVDASRLFVQGGSQGGALTLAAAALTGRPLGVIADVPFLSDFRRALELTEADPYGELSQYLRAHRGAEERVFETLSYFDVVNFARRVSVPGLFSVGLRDEITPASTVFGAYNAYAGDKELEVYAWNGHENGETFQQRRQLAWLRDRLG